MVTDASVMPGQMFSNNRSSFKGQMGSETRSSRRQYTLVHRCEVTHVGMDGSNAGLLTKATPELTIILGTSEHEHTSLEPFR